jgi:hypothetical protein
VIAKKSIEVVFRRLLISWDPIISTSCEKLTIIVPTHNRAARVVDSLLIAAACSHFDVRVNVDSDDDNDAYDPY